METTELKATVATNARRFHPTPGRLLVVLLIVEVILLLSEQFQWFAFNEKKGWTVLIAVATVGVFLLLILFWFIVSLIFRWRFQFSIRSLLVLTVAVAIPSSWLAVELRRAKEQREAVEAASCSVYDSAETACCRSCYSGNGIDWVEGKGGTKPSELGWLRQFLGRDFFFNVIDLDFVHPEMTDANLKSLEGLYSLQQLNVSYSKVTNAGIAYLKGLTQLESLSLEHTEVTDTGLEHLRGLTNLQKLMLMDTKLTDAGLQHLQGMNRLQRLDLRYTKVTDAGLRHLETLKDLRSLDLVGTQVTDNGIDNLVRLPCLLSVGVRETTISESGKRRLEWTCGRNALRMKCEGVEPKGFEGTILFCAPKSAAFWGAILHFGPFPGQLRCDLFLHDFIACSIDFNFIACSIDFHLEIRHLHHRPVQKPCPALSVSQNRS